MKRKDTDKKVKIMLAAVFLVLVVLLAKISFIQLVQTEQFRTLARNNYIRIVPVFAPRGEIFDRNGEKIVTNRPIYTVSINDINISGTTYHVVLDRVGADTVMMSEQLARVLVRDPEYIRQAGGNVQDDGDPAENIRLIADRIKQRVGDNKSELEKGKPLELAVVYDPDAAAALSGQQWQSYGIRVEKKTDMLSKLVAMLFPKGVFEDENPYAVERRIREIIRGKKAYESVLVAEDIPLETVVELRERQLELPGVVVDIQPTREYPYDELMSHALGYVQNIKAEQYQEHKDEGYLMNDLFGQNGLELVFERYLRGEHGARQVEVDTYSRPVRDLGMKHPVPGNDLVLTVDLEVQQAAEKALAEGALRARKAGYGMARAGAAVVMDVNTGALLAMASYPSYNPGVFANLTTARWQELQENGALLNRAMSLYPPGSTFKMVTAAAILENNVVDPEYKMPDPGYFVLGRRYNDWKPGGHGHVDMRAAIQFSCDTYFWQYGRLAGVEAIARYAREFGLGQVTGLGLPGEMAGAVPDPEYKYELVKSYLIRYNPDFARVRELNRRIEQVQNELREAGGDTEKQRRLEGRKKGLESERDKELEEQLKKHEWDLRWQAFDTLNMAIGQGDNWYSPLQLAAYTAAIANGGTLYKPYLVQRVVSPGGEVIKEFDGEVRHQVNVKPDNLKIIQEGMHLVTVPPGTASGVFAGATYTAAAKTGTAEVFDAAGRKKDNHALFVAYAPYEKPEVAVAVILEYGHSGSGYAGPIARHILDAYFGEEPKSLLPLGEGEAEQVVPDDIPAVAWPGWEKRPAADSAADVRFRYYDARLKRLEAERKQIAPQRRAASRPAAPVPSEPPTVVEPEPPVDAAPGPAEPEPGDDGQQARPPVLQPAPQPGLPGNENNGQAD